MLADFHALISRSRRMALARSGMWFGPHRGPWPVLAREFADNLVVPIMIKTRFSDYRYAQRRSVRRDFEEYRPRTGIGSSGRIRTYDQSVNSRPLYH